MWQDGGGRAARVIQKLKRGRGTRTARAAVTQEDAPPSLLPGAAAGVLQKTFVLVRDVVRAAHGRRVARAHPPAGAEHIGVLRGGRLFTVCGRQRRVSVVLAASGVKASKRQGGS